MTQTYTISALLFQDDGWWSAQCLEYDIATQAKTLPDLHYELERTLTGYFVLAAELGTEPFAGIEKAPKKFWDRFAQSQMHVERPRSPFRLPRGIPVSVQPDLRIAELQPA